MFDEQNETQGISESIQEDVPEVPQEQQEQQEQSATQDKPAPQQDDEYTKRVQNWRALREKADRAERAEREKAELEKLLQKYESAGSQPEPQEEDDNLSDEDLIEKRHLKKFEKKHAEKFKAQEQRLKKMEQDNIEARLNSELPDFKSVVNEDTLPMLRDADPDLAQSILSNPNPYSQAKAAYKAIKMYGLAREDAYSKKRDKVHENSSKPRPVSSVSPQQGNSPLSRANAFAEGLTPELARQLWKEIQDARKE